MSKILVTGAEGFLGSSLVPKLLQLGHEVTTCDLNAQSIKGSNFHIQGNLTDYLVLDKIAKSKIEVVIHLAAQTSVIESLKDPIRDLNTNVVSTLMLLSALDENKELNFIYGQSGGSIYSKYEKVPYSEEASVNPESPYGLSKFMAEKYIALKCREKKWNWSSLAFSNLYGFYNQNRKGVIYEFLRCFLENLPVNIYGPELTRDYLFVDDAVAAIIQSIEIFPNRRINVASGVETSTKNLYKKMVNFFPNYEIEPNLFPVIQGEVQRSCLNISLAGTLLGWYPKTDLDSGLRSVVNDLELN